MDDETNKRVEEAMKKIAQSLGKGQCFDFDAIEFREGYYYLMHRGHVAAIVNEQTFKQMVEEKKCSKLCEG